MFAFDFLSQKFLKVVRTDIYDILVVLVVSTLITGVDTETVTAVIELI